MRSIGKSRIAGVINDVEKILVGLLLVFLSAIAYAIVYLFLFNHAFATLTMCGTSLAELWTALFMLRRQ